jgi:hypothetical protein
MGRNLAGLCIGTTTWLDRHPRSLSITTYTDVLVELANHLPQFLTKLTLEVLFDNVRFCEHIYRTTF